MATEGLSQHSLNSIFKERIYEILHISEPNNSKCIKILSLLHTNKPTLFTKYRKDLPVILASRAVLVRINVSTRSKTYLRDPKRIYEIQTYLRDLSSYLWKLKSQKRIILNNQRHILGDEIYQRWVKNSKEFLSKTWKYKTYLRDPKCIYEIQNVSPR